MDLDINFSKGANTTVLGLIGDSSTIDIDLIEKSKSEKTSDAEDVFKRLGL